MKEDRVFTFPIVGSADILFGRWFWKIFREGVLQRLWFPLGELRLGPNIFSGRTPNPSFRFGADLIFYQLEAFRWFMAITTINPGKFIASTGHFTLMVWIWRIRKTT